MIIHTKYELRDEVDFTYGPDGKNKSRGIITAIHVYHDVMHIKYTIIPTKATEADRFYEIFEPSIIGLVL